MPSEAPVTESAAAPPRRQRGRRVAAGRRVDGVGQHVPRRRARSVGEVSVRPRARAPALAVGRPYGLCRRASLLRAPSIIASGSTFHRNQSPATAVGRPCAPAPQNRGGAAAAGAGLQAAALRRALTGRRLRGAVGLRGAVEDKSIPQLETSLPCLRSVRAGAPAQNCAGRAPRPGLNARLEARRRWV